MAKKGLVMDYTPFIFEDGKMYYFRLYDREYTNDYYDLYVYDKVKIDKATLIERLLNKERIIFLIVLICYLFVLL